MKSNETIVVRTDAVRTGDMVCSPEIRQFNLLVEQFDHWTFFRFDSAPVPVLVQYAIFRGWIRLADRLKEAAALVNVQ